MVLKLLLLIWLMLLKLYISILHVSLLQAVFFLPFPIVFVLLLLTSAIILKTLHHIFLRFVCFVLFIIYFFIDPTKYFGVELGAQSKYNIVSERAIVNGSHTSSDLQKILDKFIQQFILCPVCYSSCYSCAPWLSYFATPV